jgi:hypothetical protein
MGFDCEVIKEPETWNHILETIDEQNAFYKLAWMYQAKPKTTLIESQSIRPDHLIPSPSYEEMIERQLGYLISSGFLVRG